VIECVHLTLVHLSGRKTESNSKESVQEPEKTTENVTETISPMESSKQLNKLSSTPIEDPFVATHAPSGNEEIPTFTIPSNFTEPKVEPSEVSQIIPSEDFKVAITIPS
ncbi:hypothetical protein PMAYCL1PPCAC_13932, partial [Pristionchus mayeri]